MKESTPLTLYVAYTAKPGCRETFVRQIVMEGIADTIRREEGCIATTTISPPSRRTKSCWWSSGRRRPISASICSSPTWPVCGS